MKIGRVVLYRRAYLLMLLSLLVGVISAGAFAWILFASRLQAQKDIALMQGAEAISTELRLHLHNARDHAHANINRIQAAGEYVAKGAAIQDIHGVINDPFWERVDAVDPEILGRMLRNYSGTTPSRYTEELRRSLLDDTLIAGVVLDEGSSRFKIRLIVPILTSSRHRLLIVLDRLLWTKADQDRYAEHLFPFYLWSQGRFERAFENAANLPGQELTDLGRLAERTLDSTSCRPMLLPVSPGWSAVRLSTLHSGSSCLVLVAASKRPPLSLAQSSMLLGIICLIAGCFIFGMIWIRYRLRGLTTLLEWKRDIPDQPSTSTLLSTLADDPFAGPLSTELVSLLSDEEKRFGQEMENRHGTFALVSGIDHPWLLLDPDGTILQAGAAAQELFNQRPEQLVGTQAARLFIPSHEDVERWFHSLWSKGFLDPRRLETSLTGLRQVWGMRLDSREALIVLSPYPTAIAERSQTPDWVSQSVEHAPFGMAYVSGGVVVSGNTLFCTSLGFSDPREVWGHTIDDLFPMVGRSKLQAWMSRIGDNDETPERIEFMLSDGSGHVRRKSMIGARNPETQEIWLYLRDFTVFYERITQIESQSAIGEALWGFTDLPLCLMDAKGMPIRQNQIWQEVILPGWSWVVGGTVTLPESPVMASREAQEKIRQVLRGKAVRLDSVELLDNAGDPSQRRRFDLHLIPVKDAQGGFDSVLIAAFDVTPIAKAREEIELYRSRFDWLAQITPDIVYVYNTTAGFQYLSQKVDRLTGYTATEISRNIPLIGTLLHPDDRERVLQVFERILAGEIVPFLSTRIVRRDGQSALLEHRGQITSEPDGSITLRGYARDLSSLAALQETYKRIQGTWLSVFNAVEVGLVATNPEGCVTMANRWMEEFTGCSTQEMVGRTISQIQRIPSALFESSWEADVRASGHSMTQTRRLGDRSYMVTLIPLQDPEQLILWLIRDITDWPISPSA